MVMTGSSRHPHHVFLAVITGMLACVAALLAGCDSTSSKTTSTAAGSLTPSSSSLTSAAPSASPASESQLAKIVLQPSDLPADWARTQAHPGDTPLDRAFAKCVGDSSTDGDKVAEANSDDFILGDARLGSSAASFRSQGSVDSDVATVRGSKASRASQCVEQAIKQPGGTDLPAGATLESVSFKITPGSAGGPANVVATYAGSVKANMSGKQVVSLYAQGAFITGPLIEASVFGSSLGAPIPASVMNSAVAAVANRAAHP
jgi:hypothetical protein